MQTTTMTRTDSEIQRDVLSELKWDPRVSETEVGVQVKQGIVTLTGPIGSYAKKLTAVDAAHRVRGVLDVANDLAVEYPGAARTDTEIARALREALHWNVYVDEKKIHSTVTNGWVTLEGEVGRWHEREDASRAIQHLGGVRGVTNKIMVVSPGVDNARIRTQIEAALARQAEREAKRITVDVDNGVVKLTGVVRSWSERKAVERAAGFAPGVIRVQDDLVVDTYS